jgi:hypothetical protein
VAAAVVVVEASFVAAEAFACVAADAFVVACASADCPSFVVVVVVVAVASFDLVPYRRNVAAAAAAIADVACTADWAACPSFGLAGPSSLTTSWPVEVVASLVVVVVAAVVVVEVAFD